MFYASPYLHGSPPRYNEYVVSRAITLWRWTLISSTHVHDPNAIFCHHKPKLPLSATTPPVIQSEYRHVSIGLSPVLISKFATLSLSRQNMVLLLWLLLGLFVTFQNARLPQRVSLAGSHRLTMLMLFSRFNLIFGLHHLSIICSTMSLLSYWVCIISATSTKRSDVQHRGFQARGLEVPEAHGLQPIYCQVVNTHREKDLITPLPFSCTAL